jgi:hypothetical protein
MIADSEMMHRFAELIEDAANLHPSAGEYELAYQARIAVDRIRFAIKHVERFGTSNDQLFEANLQLLDALDRLETTERRFQTRFRRNQKLGSGNGTERTRQG